jgi:hypothetical protein
MEIIHALGKDGRSIMPDLQGASPTGGFVTSESRNGHLIELGHLVRHHGWSVVAGIVQDGITGLCHLALIDADGNADTRTLYRGQSDEVRTDVKISPDTLFKIRPSKSMVTALQVTGEAATAFAGQVAALPEDGDPARTAGILRNLIMEARALLGQQPPAGRNAHAGEAPSAALDTVNDAAGPAALNNPPGSLRASAAVTGAAGGTRKTTLSAGIQAPGATLR